MKIRTLVITAFALLACAFVVSGIGYANTDWTPFKIENGKRILDLDSIDYYRHNNIDYTWSGLCTTLIDENKPKFISELWKDFKGRIISLFTNLSPKRGDK